MKPTRTDYSRILAVFLLTLLIVIGISVWLLDLIVQQRTFGLLMSAELIAFALLVYIFYHEDPATFKKLTTISLVSLSILILLAAVTFSNIASTPKPNVSASLYAGEISVTVYGFGSNPTDITSPGPTLTFKLGDIVNMTLFNAGRMPHNWALVTTNQTSAPVLFSAEIASGSVPIQSNQTGSVIFKATESGNFYYICQVPGHAELGMWGIVVINP